MKSQITIFLYLLILFTVSTVQGQVTLSPTVIFLEPTSNVGTFYISNPSDVSLEVQLSFEFAYPQTDNKGNVYLNYDDSEASERFSLKPYVRAFPTKFMLKPFQRQTVRISGRIPGHKEDGLHWTRLRISSNQVSEPITSTENSGLNARVSLQINQITAVFAQKGSVNTALKVLGTNISIDNGRLSVLTDVKRTGNAPFIGSVFTRIYNEHDELVAEREAATSVYFKNTQKAEFEIDDWPDAEYYVEMEFRTERTDISSGHLIQTDPVTNVKHFRIQ